LTFATKKPQGISKTTNQHGKTTKQSVERTLISEGNLYRLIIRSKLPAAIEFERWVFDTVLPSIRKDGFYIAEELREQLAVSEAARMDFAKRLVKEQKAHISVIKAPYLKIKQTLRSPAITECKGVKFGLTPLFMRPGLGCPLNGRAYSNSPKRAVGRGTNRSDERNQIPPFSTPL